MLRPFTDLSCLLIGGRAEEECPHNGGETARAIGDNLGRGRGGGEGGVDKLTRSGARTADTADTAGMAIRDVLFGGTSVENTGYKINIQLSSWPYLHNV